MSLLDKYHAEEAVLAALDGDYSLLAKRLRAAAKTAAQGEAALRAAARGRIVLRAPARNEVILTSDELKLTADIIARPDKHTRGPLTSPAMQDKARLKKSKMVAGEVLARSHGYTRGEVPGAVLEVAKIFKLSESSVKGDIRKARCDRKWWAWKCKHHSPKDKAPD